MISLPGATTISSITETEAQSTAQPRSITTASSVSRAILGGTRSSSSMAPAWNSEMIGVFSRGTILRAGGLALCNGLISVFAMASLSASFSSGVPRLLVPECR